MRTIIKSIISSSALAVALSSAPGAVYAGPRDTPIRACTAQALPSTAWIKVDVATRGKDGKPQMHHATGAGSVVDSRGLVLTNDHVLFGENGDGEVKDIAVGLYGDNGEFRHARVLAHDRNVDLAVLQIDTGKEKSVPEQKFGPSSDLAAGEPSIVIGSPYGFPFSVSAGIISKMQVPKPGDEDGGIYMIQTDASVNPGNSGGKILNANCEQVGVVELKYGDAGLGFAITSDRAARWLAEKLPASAAGVYPSNQPASMPQIVGADGQPLPAEMVAMLASQGRLPPELTQASETKSVGVYHGIRSVSLKVVSEDGPERQKVSVKELAVGSPAASVLQLGDQIDTIDGHYVGNQFDVERFFGGKQPGDEVKIHIERAGKPMDVVLKLVAAPAVEQTKD